LQAQPSPKRCFRASATRNLVLALESLNPASGIDDLLLTRKEWVAIVTNLDLDRVLGGPGRELVTACTADTALDVFGMDFSLHDSLRMRTTSNRIRSFQRGGIPPHAQDGPYLPVEGNLSSPQTCSIVNLLLELPLRDRP
jgi:hypothetical protein